MNFRPQWGQGDFSSKSSECAGGQLSVGVSEGCLNDLNEENAEIIDGSSSKCSVTSSSACSAGVFKPKHHLFSLSVLLYDRFPRQTAHLFQESPALFRRSGRTFERPWRDAGFHSTHQPATPTQMGRKTTSHGNGKGHVYRGFHGLHRGHAIHFHVSESECIPKGTAAGMFCLPWSLSIRLNSPTLGKQC